MRRRRLALVLLAGMAIGATVVTLQVLGQRSPGELIRYLERGLQGHPRIQSLTQPLLARWRQQVERPVALTHWPTMGRGPASSDATVPVGAIEVNSVVALRHAMREAVAGQTLVLLPGIYRIESTLSPQRGGRPEAPITLRGGAGVILESVTTEAFKVTQPYWVFEHLTIRGRCVQDHDCEHAFHVVGAAVGTEIRHNHLEDFNAAIKVNGEDGMFPDDGRLRHNRIANQAPRLTDRPVTLVDIVAASGWLVSDNLVSHFVKDGGNRTSYGIFMKGGGRGGRVERNLVICTPADVSRAGQRVGISLGGGGTGRPWCRDAECATEHHDGLVTNNIVAHCNDAGLDVNRAQGALRHNTLINTAGILVRGGGTASVNANLLDGALRVRPPATAVAEGNVGSDMRKWFVDADALDLTWSRAPMSVSDAFDRTDFCGRPTGPMRPAGALSEGPC